MKRSLNYLSICLLLFVAACGALGVATPQTFNERTAAAYASVTAVRESATTLLKAGKIKADDAQNVQDGANNARAGIDIARGLEAQSPGAGKTRLDVAIAALQALQAYLNSKEPTK